MRLLLLSNNPVSLTNANGRTLKNLLYFFKSEELAQIYTTGESYDSSFCSSFLGISDGEVIKSFFKRSAVISDKKKVGEAEETSSPSGKKGKKTALTMLLRDIVWSNCRSVKKKILSFAKEFSPDAILFQMGDAAFTVKYASFLAKNLNIPLFVYNTEDYYFKDYDFMKKNGKKTFFYRIFHRKFCKAVDDMMKLKPKTVYNCEGLKDLYNKKFSDNGIVIYNSSSFKPKKDAIKNGLILYAGNLGVGRHKSLIKLSKLLKKVESDAVITVYGNASKEVLDDFAAADNIDYRGFVDYDTVCSLLSGAKLLVHVESFDEYFVKDSRYAFSTKLSDYCAAGVPMLLYLNDTCEAYSFFTKNGGAFVVKGEETDSVYHALFDEEKRLATVKRAKELFEIYNDPEKNGRQFRNYVETELNNG